MKDGVIASDGNEILLPSEIAKGIHDPWSRQKWNASVLSGFGPVSESWREYIARRNHCLESRSRLKEGVLSSVTDFVTMNLDIRQLAQDVVQGTDSPDLLLAVYEIIRSVRILDPTCGSGAFLFQALNVLEPLYDGCLNQMDKFVHRVSELPNGEYAKSISAFQDVLREIELHPSRRYFIMKSIILNNLFGVDIMEEATEICKLRLFLKLAAQIEPDFSKSNLGLEPLPDIDFNIRRGNALVGFTTYEQVKKSITSGQLKLGIEETLITIQKKAELADRAFNQFRDLQREATSDDAKIKSAKRELESRSAQLGAELDRYIAIDYRVKLDKESAFSKWKETYKPFHWFLEFYAIMKSGGFDVIVGNPPYLEIREVDYFPIGFLSEETKAIHAMCLSGAFRCFNLLVLLA